MSAMFVSSGFLSTADKRCTFDWSALPPFLRVLLTTDGTVTKSLESYFWEPVNVMATAQAAITLDTDIAAIHCNAGDTVWQRDVQLVGASSHRVFATAQSFIHLDALPKDMQQALQKGQMGIGEFLRECEYETYREILDVGTNQDKPNGFVWRTYRIMMNKKPLMQITEQFNQAMF